MQATTLSRTGCATAKESLLQVTGIRHTMIWLLYATSRRIYLLMHQPSSFAGVARLSTLTRPGWFRTSAALQGNCSADIALLEHGARYMCLRVCHNCCGLLTCRTPVAAPHLPFNLWASLWVFWTGSGSTSLQERIALGVGSLGQLSPALYVIPLASHRAPHCGSCSTWRDQHRQPAAVRTSMLVKPSIRAGLMKSQLNACLETPASAAGCIVSSQWAVLVQNRTPIVQRCKYI